MALPAIEYMLPESPGAQLSDGSFQVTVEKGENIPVLAYLSGTNICAAGFFPKDYKDGVLRLTWIQGPLGVIVRRLYQNGLPVELLDIGEIQERMLKAGEGDPWRCDLEQLTTILAYGGKPPSHISITGERPVDISTDGELAPAFPLLLYPSDPFAKIPDLASGAALIPCGVSCYFDPGGNIYTWYVDNEGWSCSSPVMEYAVSGCW